MKKIYFIIFLSLIISLNLQGSPELRGSSLQPSYRHGSYLFNQEWKPQIKNKVLSENDLPPTNNIKNPKVDNLSQMIDISGFLIAAASLIFAIFLSVIGYMTFYKYKALQNKIENRLKLVENYSKEVFKIKKKLLTNQNYIKQAIEEYGLIFEHTAHLFSGSKTSHEFDLLVFESQSIIGLYSPDKEIRFFSITNLYGRGSEKSIKHLKNVILNPEEIKEIKQLALKTLTKIEINFLTNA